MLFCFYFLIFWFLLYLVFILSFYSFIVSPIVLKDGGIREEVKGTTTSRMAKVYFEKFCMCSFIEMYFSLSSGKSYNNQLIRGQWVGNKWAVIGEKWDRGRAYYRTQPSLSRPDSVITESESTRTWQSLKMLNDIVILIKEWGEVRKTLVDGTAAFSWNPIDHCHIDVKWLECDIFQLIPWLLAWITV